MGDAAHEFEEVVKIRFIDMRGQYPVGERANLVYAEGSDTPHDLRLTPAGDWRILECRHDEDEGTRLTSVTLGRPASN